MSERSLIALSMLVCSAGAAQAEPCTCEALQERVRTLEQRLADMERRLGDVADTAAPAPATPKTVVPAQAARPPGRPAARGEPQAASGAVDAPTSDSKSEVVGAGNAANARYWILEDKGSPMPTSQADTHGRIPFTGKVSFHPSTYGLGRDRWFSPYTDPSLYPAAAVLISGTLETPESGRYELVVTPKPAREGGSAVRSSLEYSVAIGGVEVVPATETRSWSANRRTVHLDNGAHRVEIRALARSPGFGPSPTDSTLGIELRGPRDAAPRPLVLSAD